MSDIPYIYKHNQTRIWNSLIDDGRSSYKMYGERLCTEPYNYS